MLDDFSVQEMTGRVRFASIDDLVSTERACVWTLGGLLDNDQFAALRCEAATAMAPFTTSGGQVDFEMPATVLTARKAA